MTFNTRTEQPAKVYSPPDPTEIDKLDITDLASLHKYVNRNFYKLHAQPSVALETLAQKIIDFYVPKERPKQVSMEELCRVAFESRISGKAAITVPNGLVPILANRIFNAMNYKIPDSFAIEMLPMNPDGSMGLIEHNKYHLKFKYIGKMTGSRPAVNNGQNEARKSQRRRKNSARNVIGTAESRYRMLQNINSLMAQKKTLFELHNSNVARRDDLHLMRNGTRPQLCIGELDVPVKNSEKKVSERASLAGKILDELDEMTFKSHRDGGSEWHIAKNIARQTIMASPEPPVFDPLVGPERPHDLQMLTLESRQKLAQVMAQNRQYATFNQGYVEYIANDPAMKLLAALQSSAIKQEDYWYKMKQDVRYRDTDTPFMKSLEAFFTAEVDKKNTVQEHTSWSQTLMEVDHTAYELWGKQLKRKILDIKLYRQDMRAREMGVRIATPIVPQIRSMPRDQQYWAAREAMYEPHKYMMHAEAQEHNVDNGQPMTRMYKFEMVGESEWNQRIRLFKETHSDDDGVCDSGQ